MAATYNAESYRKLAKHTLILMLTNTDSDITNHILKVIDQLKNIDDLKALQSAFAKRKGRTLIDWIKWREQYNKGLMNSIAVKLQQKNISLS
jgi:hypothetical protein